MTDKELINQLDSALQSAFPTIAELRKMVSTGLDRNLDSIASIENLSISTFELIRWAIANGKLEELVENAHKANPANPKLRRVAEQFLNRTDSPLDHDQKIRSEGLSTMVEHIPDRNEIMDCLRDVHPDELDFIVEFLKAGDLVPLSLAKLRKVSALIGWADCDPNVRFTQLYNTAKKYSKGFEVCIHAHE